MAKNSSITEFITNATAAAAQALDDDASQEPSLCMKHDVSEEAIVGRSERLESDQAHVTCKIRNMSLEGQNTCINIMKNASEPGTKADKVYVACHTVKTETCKLGNLQNWGLCLELD